MASKGANLCVLAVLVMMLCHGATAQSGCTIALVGLSPCLSYVSGNGSSPSSSCCSQLANVVQSQPLCLCALLNGGGSSLGIAINQTLALSLPGACKVQTPPVSQCNESAASPAISPAISPASLPADDTPETPNTPETANGPPVPPSLPVTPAGGGSKTVPTARGTSAASVSRMQLHLTIFVIFIASCASNVIIRF
ncbi:hypothetical protein JCGZ_21901 [Jatropha curcas]|uniref:Bifunctional inhibitor/plant lipid transfer protein/seed storage helical domain-containing protein n=1 Tax=Jatropha curcas TaxID=180498 RepID=A0A067JN30_JATCU|nr:non-specific lipid-transfer protein-like protein At2g13820 [Jatropha curcas]KDP21430.1 hypothetical protein JCGZ_21901 [Jatropha curcas]